MPLLGTSPEAIDLAEDRGRFGALLGRLELKAPPYATARSAREALAAAPRRSASRCSCARATCSAAGRWRSSTTTAGLEDYLRACRAARGDLPRPLPRERHRGRRRRAVRRQRRLDRRDHAARRGGRHPLGRLRLRAAAALARRRDARPRSARPRARSRWRSAWSGCSTSSSRCSGDDLYVIEANPRASRTVPFVSKATGLPLAKLACRVMLGEPLADARAARRADRRPRGGQGGGAALRPLPGLRRAARPRDALDRRGDGRRARLPGRLRQGAGGGRAPGCRSGGTVFLTVTDGDKPAAVGIASQLHDLGFRIVATRGTAAAISRMGIPCERLNKLGEGSPHVVDWIERGDVDLVINTPTGTAARTDGYEIRRAAVARGVPCITTLSGGMAAARAIAAARQRGPAGGVAAGAALERCAARARVIERAPSARSRRSGAGSPRSPATPASAPTTCSPATTPTARRRTRASSTCSPPPSAGAAGTTSARSCRAPSRSCAVTRTAGSTSCSRTSGRAPRGSRELRPGDGLWILGPLGRGFRGAAAGPPADPRRRRGRDRPAGHLAGPPRRRRRSCCSASATPPTPPGRRCCATHGSPPTTARPATAAR